MNKKLLIFFLVSASLLMLACSKTPPDLQDRTGYYQDLSATRFTGLISTFNLDLYQEGTHQLETDEGKVVIIQSPTINLSRYIGKKVTIEGSMKTMIDDRGQVFTVKKIMLADTEGLDKMTDYQDLKQGFNLKYPAIWQLSENTDQLSFHVNGKMWAQINILLSTQSLSDFVADKEGGEGDAVTIGAQKSLRYIEEDQIRLYIPNSSRGKIYQLIFFDDGEEAAIYKDLFYDLVESFTPLTGSDSSPEGVTCGGQDSIQCEEGFRCELDSGEEDSLGVCVAIKTTSDQNPNCPFVPLPSSCERYEVRSRNKNNCPLSYICLDENGDEEGQDVNSEKGEAQKEDADRETEVGSTPSDPVVRVTEAFRKRQDQILSPAAEVSQFEVVEEQNLMAAVYVLSEVKMKTWFEYKPSANEFNFYEIAHYEEGEETDWELKDGKAVQITAPRKVISVDEERVMLVPDDRRLYENSRYHFSLFYPKDWYYRSFGAIENSVWTGGFNDQSLDDIADAKISVSIQDNAVSQIKKQAKGGAYIVTLPRDENTHFRIEGKLTYKADIDIMSESIK